MIYIVGEIVCDFFGKDNEKLNFECNIGGAPLNLSSNLANLHVKNKFLGYLSKDDILTSYIIKKISAWNNEYVDYHLLIKPNCENAMYFSFLSNSDNTIKNHMYCTQDASYRLLNLNELELFTKDSVKNDIIHFGSLMFANKDAYKTICKFLNKYKNKFFVSFDFNFREHVHKSFDSDICERMIKFVKKYVNILKVTKEELQGILKSSDFEKKLSMLNNQKIIYITDNKNGASCYFQNKFITKKAAKITNVVDSLGCGDAFYSGVLSVINNVKINNLNQKDIEKSLIIGNRCGALTLQKHGATSGFAYDDVFIDY